MNRTGGCLCGAVRYTVRGPVRNIVVCHCCECRRWTGGAWPATAAARGDLDVDDTALVWVASPDSDSRARRGFCGRCGSTLLWDAPGRDAVSFGAGTLDDPGGLVVTAHIWVEQAASRAELPEHLPAWPRGIPAR